MVLRPATAFAALALVNGAMLAHGVVATASTQVRGNQDTSAVASLGRQEDGYKRNLPTARHKHAPIKRLRRANASEHLINRKAAEAGTRDKQEDTTVTSKVANETQWKEPGTAQLFTTREALMAHISQGVLKAIPMQLVMKMQSQSTIGQEPDMSEPVGTAALWLSLGQFLVLGALTLLFAYYYKAHKANVMDHLGLQNTTQDKLLLEKKEFAYPLFACLDEPKLCLFSCCCAPVRWADSLRLLGMFTLMTGVCVFLGTELLGYILPGGGIILLAMLTYCRQALRAKFDMPHGTCMTYMEDCCSYCWCSVCAITQEARQVELAAKVGHPAIVKEE